MVTEGVGGLVQRVDALGGYFRLEAGLTPAAPGSPAGLLTGLLTGSLPGAGQPSAPDWRPLRELVAAPEYLREQVIRVRREWASRVPPPGAGPEPAPAEVEIRASASLVHLGLVARLAAPVVAAMALGDTVLDLHPDRAGWRRPGEGDLSIALRVPMPSADRFQDGDGRARAFARLVLEPALLPLEDVLHRHLGVSRQVLRGNLVSAMAGAATVLDGVMPPAGHRAWEQLTATLRLPALAGAGGFEGARQFRRRSCCLYYRLPGGGLCGDCILAARG